MENETPNLETLKIINSQAIESLNAISQADSLEEWRIKYLGRKGIITQLLKSIPQIAPSERRTFGAKVNQIKNSLNTIFVERKNSTKNLTASSKTNTNQIDITLPGWPFPKGSLHITTQMIKEISDTFQSLGFQSTEGPEVEFDHYNFGMLNIPQNHPARDMWNSIWIEGTDTQKYESMLLRTHTSPMQVRIMENTKPPIRIIVPGKCYRYEATDATHEWHFYQIEGLAIDKGITFADLKGTLYEFAQKIFGEGRQIRFRCDFFPFVEPGVDMSISNFKNSSGHRPIKGRNEDWIEILGAGMVHPNVLRAVGYDPEIYTGFAFGMGVERIAMLKYGIDDIRLFYSNNLNFLTQF